MSSRASLSGTHVAVVLARTGLGSKASALARLGAPKRISPTSTRPTPNTAICSARCSALTISGPELRRGDCRSRSSVETRDPLSGTCSNSASRRGNPRSTRRVAASSASCNRASAASRAAATCRASTVTPVSGTRLRRNEPTAWSNSVTGAFGMCPGATVEEPRERLDAILVLEEPIAIPVADLPRVLVQRLRPVHILLHARRVADRQLLDQELHRRPRHIQRILQEPPDRPDRAQLHSETEAMVVRSSPRDQVPIGVIEIEEPLHLGAGRLTHETAGRGDLLIGQELHRHESRP
jgi:hypothetical protein